MNPELQLADEPHPTKPTVLDEAASARLLERLSDSWVSADAALIRSFKFPDFDATMAFVNGLADIARHADHHPDVRFGYNTAHVSWTSHDAGGLTLSDFICAAQTDRLTL